MSVTIEKPPAAEVPQVLRGYLEEAPEGNILEALEASLAGVTALLEKAGDARGGFRYASGKWSVKEVAGHLIDVERIFVYRALRFARGDTTPLPGFDENAYTPQSGADARPMSDLIRELVHLRQADIALFAGLDPASWSRKGLANGADLTVRTVPYMLAGHERHHLRVLGERYETAW